MPTPSDIRFPGSSAGVTPGWKSPGYTGTVQPEKDNLRNPFTVRDNSWYPEYQDASSKADTAIPEEDVRFADRSKSPVGLPAKSDYVPGSIARQPSPAERLWSGFDINNDHAANARNFIDRMAPEEVETQRRYLQAGGKMTPEFTKEFHERGFMDEPYKYAENTGTELREFRPQVPNMDQLNKVVDRRDVYIPGRLGRAGIAGAVVAADHYIPRASNDSVMGRASNMSRDFASTFSKDYGAAQLPAAVAAGVGAEPVAAGIEAGGALVGGLHGAYNVASNWAHGKYSPNGEEPERFQRMRHQEEVRMHPGLYREELAQMANRKSMDDLPEQRPYVPGSYSRK
jgi:hypothetical protein